MQKQIHTFVVWIMTYGHASASFVVTYTMLTWAFLTLIYLNTFNENIFADSAHRLQIQHLHTL